MNSRMLLMGATVVLLCICPAHAEEYRVIPVVVNILTNSGANPAAITAAIERVNTYLEENGKGDVRLRVVKMNENSTLAGITNGNIPESELNHVASDGEAELTNTVPGGKGIKITVANTSWVGSTTPGWAYHRRPSFVIKDRTNVNDTAETILHEKLHVLTLIGVMNVTSNIASNASGHVTNMPENAMCPSNWRTNHYITSNQWTRIVTDDVLNRVSIVITNNPASTNAPAKQPQQTGSYARRHDTNIVSESDYLVLYSEANAMTIQGFRAFAGRFPSDANMSLQYSLHFNTDGNHDTGIQYPWIQGIDREVIVNIAWMPPFLFTIHGLVRDPMTGDEWPLPDDPELLDGNLVCDIDTMPIEDHHQISFVIPKILLNLSASTVPVGFSCVDIPTGAILDTGTFVYNQTFWEAWPTLQLKQNTAEPGKAVPFTLSGMTPLSRFKLYADTKQVGAGSLSAAGSFSGFFTFPVVPEGRTVYLYAHDTNGPFTFSVLTALPTAISTNSSNQVISGIVTNTPNGSGRRIFWTGVISGTGMIVQMNETCTNTYVGTIAPGMSPGSLDMVEAQGTMQFGTAGDTLMINVEDGDRLNLRNMDVVLDLGRIEVTYLNATLPGTTNWYLTCDSGFIGTFAAEHYGTCIGYTVYDVVNNRVGAVLDYRVPFVDVTNDNFSVSAAASSATIGGTSVFCVGALRYECYSNSPSGPLVAAGSIAADSSWQATDSNLVVGLNMVQVIGTNAAGVQYIDVVMIIRQSGVSPADVEQFSVAMAAGGTYGVPSLSWSNGTVTLLACTNRYYSTDPAQWFVLATDVASPWTHTAATDFASVYYRIISGPYTSAYDVGKFDMDIAAGSIAWLSFPFAPQEGCDVLSEWFGQQLEARNYNAYSYPMLQVQDGIGGPVITRSYYIDNLDSGTTNWFSSDDPIVQNAGYVLFLAQDHPAVKLTSLGMVPTNASVVLQVPYQTIPWVGLSYPASIDMRDSGLVNLFTPPQNYSLFDYDFADSQQVLGGPVWYAEYFIDDWGGGTTNFFVSVTGADRINAGKGYLLFFSTTRTQTGTWYYVKP